MESHYCFISYKKEDKEGRINYVQNVIDALEEGQCLGKALDKWIDKDDLNDVMNVIREDYMKGTSVTIFLIGKHSSENEGLDGEGYNKQNYIIRELQASLYDRKGWGRNGLLGIVLPEMYNAVYGEGSRMCEECGYPHNIVNINDSTVIREFSENYYLKPINTGCRNAYQEDGRYAVLVKYDDFINEPNKYVNQAYDKRDSEIAKYVHWRDIKHKGKRWG